MIKRFIRIILLFFCIPLTAFSQEIDSLGTVPSEVDQNLLPISDTLKTDSLSSDTLVIPLNYKLSSDSLEAIVEYGCNDSIDMDNTTRIVYLYGDAYVRYLTLNLEADYIKLNLETNIAEAEGVPDSNGELQGTPIFNDGQQEIKAVKLKYNFKSKKGLVYDISTEESDMLVKGVKTKFYGKGGVDKREDHTIYNSNAIFTTCDHPEPHFGIRSKKQKVIPDKVAIVGPSNLEIGGVPTPLWLPFGFFPLKKGQRAGLIVPKDYEFSDDLGFGISNLGYYFPINDHMDFKLMGDIYLRGTWGLKSELRYRKRYKYNGSLNVGYSVYKTEIPESVDVSKRKSFFIRLSHRQDANAHPTRTIGGSVNIQTNEYESLNYNDVNRVLNNQLNSNFNISQRFAGTPFSATMGLSHSQNTKTGNMQMTLPNFSLKMKRINPFKRKKRIGPEKWYEKISILYNSDLKYNVQGADSTFFSQENFSNGKFGVQHRLNSSLNFQVFKYITISPSINFNETWYTKSTEKNFVDSAIVDIDTVYNSDSTEFNIIRDTTSYGYLDEQRVGGFKAAHVFSSGVSASTSLYKTITMNKGLIRGIRHTIKPSVSLNYTPDYTDESLGYYKTIQTRNEDGSLEEETYSIFEDETYRGPSSSGEQFGMSYSITNVLEAKVFSKKDSTANKIKIIDNLSISGNYNFAADSLKWSTMSMSGKTSLLKGLANVRYRATFDPYATDEDGRRINTSYQKSDGKLLRFVNGQIAISTGFTIKKLRDAFKKKAIDGNQEEGSSRKKEQKAEKATFWSIFDGLRLSYDFSLRSVQRSDGTHYFSPNVHSVRLTGAIPLAPSWNLNIRGLDYNFVTKTTNYPDLGLSRDLHCWTMSVNWQPKRGTYSFQINVKPGSLDFIRVPYKRNRVDGFNQF
jgi:hypothetical protein